MRMGIGIGLALLIAFFFYFVIYMVPLLWYTGDLSELRHTFHQPVPWWSPIGLVVIGGIIAFRWMRRWD